jgi:hypothetical protein
MSIKDLEACKKITFWFHLLKVSIYNVYIICLKSLFHNWNYILQTHFEEHGLGITCNLAIYCHDMPSIFV